MAVVDGSADEIVPEQHGHLEVGLLGRHMRRHRRPERAPTKNHHLARGLEDVAAVAAAPGAGPPYELLPRDAHRAAPVLAAAGSLLVDLGLGGLLLQRRGVGGAGADGCGAVTRGGE